MQDIPFCRGAGLPLTASSGMAGHGNNHAHDSGDVDMRGKAFVLMRVCLERQWTILEEWFIGPIQPGCLKNRPRSPPI